MASRAIAARSAAMRAGMGEAGGLAGVVAVAGEVLASGAGGAFGVGVTFGESPESGEIAELGAVDESGEAGEVSKDGVFMVLGVKMGAMECVTERVSGCLARYGRCGNDGPQADRASAIISSEAVKSGETMAPGNALAGFSPERCAFPFNGCQNCALFDLAQILLGVSVSLEGGLRPAPENYFNRDMKYVYCLCSGVAV